MNILLSPQHGINPSLLVCPLCHQETTGIALCGLLKGDAEAPRHMLDQKPCDKCTEYMKQGFLVIEVNSDQSRTGRLWVVTHEAAKEVFGEQFTSKGVLLIDSEAAVKVGLTS